MLNITFGVLILLIALYLVRRTRTLPKGLRLPPGPPGKPIVGNAFIMPKSQEWLTYTQWAKEFGDLVHVEVFGQHIVFVNSIDIAHELFEKRSNIYSDRTDLPMLNDLMGFDWAFGFMHYGERWRRHRKAFHKYTQPSAAVEYLPIQTKQTRLLLQRLHELPDQFVTHLHHLAGASIMEIVYGIQVKPRGDRYLDLNERAISSMSEAATPGAFLVDTFPFLKHVPEWVPGAGFKKKARIWRGPITEMVIVPFLTVKEALRTGTARPSLTAALLEELSGRTDAPTDEEEIIRNTAGIAYLAGGDSTSTALTWFVLAMVLYPAVQRKARAELDSVIGTERLPTFEDRENLPYVDAICKETLRWHPGAPLGIGHRLMEDDVYGNYFIPKGTIVVGNAWAMLRNESLYGPDPDDFVPERFLKPGILEPTPSFGYGRRICPGRFIADNTIFIAVASILKLFDITRAKDAHGNDIPIEVTSTSGAIAAPGPFQCTIKPRPAYADNLKEILEGATS